MKGVFVILDGVADEPCAILGGKTPLEAAKTPNLDEISGKSSINYCYSVKEGVAPESSSAIVSLLGYDPSFSPRGPLEALGAGMKLRNSDLALRCNFATIDDLEDGNILDQRAGRTLTTREARILAKALNKEAKLPYKFEFQPTIQHRAVLVIRGGFSDNITNADPFYSNGAVARGHQNMKIAYSKSLDDEDDSRLAAEVINKFVRESYRILDKHPVNAVRLRKGIYPANFVLCRDAGNEPAKFKKMKGRWMALAYMPLELGIAKASGMDIYKFKYPELKGRDVYGNLYSGLNKAIDNAIRMLKKNKKRYDYFYVHIKETDIPGHDGKAEEKVRMIELIDKRFFSFIKKFIGCERLIVTADHTTSCTKKAHTAEPVPVLIYPDDKISEKRFDEKEGLKGKKIMGRELLEKNMFKK